MPVQMILLPHRLTGTHNCLCIPFFFNFPRQSILYKTFWVRGWASTCTFPWVDASMDLSCQFLSLLCSSHFWISLRTNVRPKTTVIHAEGILFSSVLTHVRCQGLLTIVSNDSFDNGTLHNEKSAADLSIESPQPPICFFPNTRQVCQRKRQDSNRSHGAHVENPYNGWWWLLTLEQTIMIGLWEHLQHENMGHVSEKVSDCTTHKTRQMPRQMSETYVSVCRWKLSVYMSEFTWECEYAPGEMPVPTSDYVSDHLPLHFLGMCVSTYHNTPVKAESCFFFKGGTTMV